MQLDYSKGYTNRSNANRFATKTAKLAKGTFDIVPMNGLFFVQPNGTVVAQIAPAPHAKPEPVVIGKPDAPAKTAKAPKAPKAKEPKAAKPKGKLPRSTCGKDYKIQPKRPTAHGVTRNSKGTVGDIVWTACDKLAGGDVARVTKAMVLETCVPKGVNPTRATLCFYLWRRFHGLRGRPNLKKTQKPAK